MFTISCKTKEGCPALDKPNMNSTKHKKEKMFQQSYKNPRYKK